MHTISLNGRELAYRDEGEGPVILWGHSYLWTPAMWDAQIARFSSSYRCIAPALWGHGESGHVADCEAYSVDALTDDMEALVDALGIDSFVIAGLSVGGMWGARLAHRLGDRVRGLVLSDTDLGEEPAESQARFLGMVGMARQAGAFPPPLADACLPFFFTAASIEAGKPFVAAFKDSLLEWDPGAINTVTAMGNGIFTRPDFLPQLAEIACPSLVVVGEEDQSRPPHEARVLADTLPNARLELIADAAHIPAVEQPEALNQVLASFLDSVHGE